MHYQVDNGVVTKYYLAGASRIATPALASGASVRKNGTLYYMLSDHLGSTSLTLNSSGTKIAELRYRAFGETRYTSGTTPTTYQFTSQRNETSLGLYFYNARWYDPSLGRFTSADTLVPAGVQGVQAWDRYAFVNNNPVRYNDPTGHEAGDMCDRGYEDCLPPPPTETPSPTVTPTSTKAPTASATWTVTSTPTATPTTTPSNPYVYTTPTPITGPDLIEKAHKGINDFVNGVINEYDATNPAGPFVGTGLDPLSPFDGISPHVQGLVDTARGVLTIFATTRSVLNMILNKVDIFLVQPITPYDQVYPYP